MSITLLDPNKVKKVRTAIIAVSIVIPIVVAILSQVSISGVDLSFLPKIYATINAITAVVLIAALVAIKRKNKNIHRALVRFALLLSVMFLVCYVAYHLTSESVKYTGSSPGIYFPLLISHIFLSVIVIPLVLFAYLFAWQGDFVRHKKWTRITWPIWFYVAVTGVVVYVMLYS
jgi:putative membrane protein